MTENECHDIRVTLNIYQISCVYLSLLSLLRGGGGDK